MNQSMEMKLMNRGDLRMWRQKISVFEALLNEKMSQSQYLCELMNWTLFEKNKNIYQEEDHIIFLEKRKFDAMKDREENDWNEK